MEQSFRAPTGPHAAFLDRGTDAVTITFPDGRSGAATKPRTSTWEAVASSLLTVRHCRSQQRAQAAPLTHVLPHQTIRALNHLEEELHHVRFRGAEHGLASVPTAPSHPPLPPSVPGPVSAHGPAPLCVLGRVRGGTRPRLASPPPHRRLHCLGPASAWTRVRTAPRRRRARPQPIPLPHAQPLRLGAPAAIAVTGLGASCAPLAIARLSVLPHSCAWPRGGAPLDPAPAHTRAPSQSGALFPSGMRRGQCRRGGVVVPPHVAGQCWRGSHPCSVPRSSAPIPPHIHPRRCGRSHQPARRPCTCRPRRPPHDAGHTRLRSSAPPAQPCSAVGLHRLDAPAPGASFSRPVPRWSRFALRLESMHAPCSSLTPAAQPSPRSCRTAPGRRRGLWRAQGPRSPGPWPSNLWCTLWEEPPSPPRRRRRSS